MMGEERHLSGPTQRAKYLDFLPFRFPFWAAKHTQLERCDDSIKRLPSLSSYEAALPSPRWLLMRRSSAQGPEDSYVNTSSNIIVPP